MTEGSNGARLQVLIVDDMEVNVDILADIMEQLGYVPLPSGSAEEAMTIMRKTLPQLILLDVSMPQIDGYEFCTILKKNPVTREIPVIFISALDSMEDKVKGLELGAADFITKPFEITEVTMRVKNQMENYRMKQEMETFNRGLHKMLAEQARKMEQEKKEILCSLAGLIEERNGMGAKHLERIGYNSRILAQSLQLSSSCETEISEDFIDLMEPASKLHDLGKLWENPEEPHTQTGVFLLRQLLKEEQESEFMKMAIAIIRFHHTDFDERQEGELPLAARIVRLVDDFDAFIREGEETKEALAESVKRIEAGSGTLYDPQLVKIVAKIQRQLRIK